MKPLIHYLPGWFLATLLAYALGLAIWPERPPVVAITMSATWGFFILLGAFRRDLRASEGTRGSAARLDFAIGLAGLALAVAWWYRVSPPRSGFKAYVFFGVVAYSLYFLVSGGMLMRDNKRTEDRGQRTED